MVIHLTKSTLFTVPPCRRFESIYLVKAHYWTDTYKRRKDHDLDALCGYLYYKTDIKFTYLTMRRWLFRQEIYDRAHSVMKMGVRVVQSEFFREFEADVIAELTKSMRQGETKDSRSIV